MSDNQKPTNDDGARYGVNRDMNLEEFKHYMGTMSAKEKHLYDIEVEVQRLEGNVKFAEQQVAWKREILEVYKRGMEAGS